MSCVFFFFKQKTAYVMRISDWSADVCSSALAGLLATAGFRDVVEIGHERKYDLYDLAIEAAPPLIERRLRREISARMRADGSEQLGRASSRERVGQSV